MPKAKGAAGPTQSLVQGAKPEVPTKGASTSTPKRDVPRPSRETSQARHGKHKKHTTHSPTGKSGLGALTANTTAPTGKKPPKKSATKTVKSSKSTLKTKVGVIKKKNKQKKQGKHSDTPSILSDALDSNIYNMPEPRPKKLGFKKKTKKVKNKSDSSTSDRSMYDLPMDKYSNTSEEYLKSEEIQKRLKNTFLSMGTPKVNMNDLVKIKDFRYKTQGFRHSVELPSTKPTTKTLKPDASTTYNLKSNIAVNSISGGINPKSNLITSTTNSLFGRIKDLGENLGVEPSEPKVSLNTRKNIIPAKSDSKQPSGVAGKPISKPSENMKLNTNAAKNIVKPSSRPKIKFDVQKSLDKLPTESKPTTDVQRDFFKSELKPYAPTRKRLSAAFPTVDEKSSSPPEVGDADVSLADVPLADVAMMRQAIMETEALLAQCSKLPPPSSWTKTGFHDSESNQAIWGLKRSTKHMPRVSLFKKKQAPKPPL